MMARKDVLKGRSIVNRNIFDLNKSFDIIDKITREHGYLDKQKEEAPLDPNAVIEFYHKKLYENSNALLYLEKLRLKKHANYERFKVGFSDASILNSLSKKQLQELKKQGLIREDDAEYFADCIIFPIFNENGKVSCIYGLDISTNEFLKPIYLDKEIPVFNEKASKVYDEVILTENMLDALSLIELEIENVISINDSTNLTARHIKLLQDNRVKTIVLAIKNEITADALKDLFVSEGFRIKVVSFHNPQSSIHEALQKEQVTRLIQEAEIFSPEEEKGLFKVKKDNGIYTFITDEVIYHIAGVKDIYQSNSKIQIKAEVKDNFHRDKIDLYTYRARQNFANDTGVKLDVNSIKVEKDLDKIIDHLEKEREKRFGNKDKEEANELSEEERELGLSFLKSPFLFQEVINDMTALGYVGEDVNKLLVWLVGVSRLLPRPLSVFIQSPPSTGKSYLMEILQKLLPEESVEWVTSSSDQAFNYMPEEDFIGKIFMMGEALHNEIVEGYIRQMQSENKLSRRVVIKDVKTGEMKTVTLKHIVKLVFMMTSTAMKVNLENLSRCIVVRVDDSKNQTELVLEMQRYQESWENYLKEKHVNPGIIKKHISAQRLLKRITIINPFEKYIKFPSIKPVMRRGQKHFLGLIKSSCIARQMQKSPIEKVNPYTNEKEPVYECDLIDYEAARRLFIEGKLLQMNNELSPKIIELYEEIRKMTRKTGKEKNIKAEEVTFIRQTVIEKKLVELEADTIKKYMKMLVDYEYLQVVNGKRHGTTFCYRLREDKPIEEMDLSSIIPDVEEIKRMMEYDKKKEIE
jgi:hypothetical protein